MWVSDGTPDKSLELGTSASNSALALRSFPGLSTNAIPAMQQVVMTNTLFSTVFTLGGVWPECSSFSTAP
jgi:hypothetical protein